MGSQKVKKKWKKSEKSKMKTEFRNMKIVVVEGSPFLGSKYQNNYK